MKARGAISICFSSISFAHLLRREEVVQRVVERLHVGVDLLLHVAGQEAEPLARLDRRAGEDDPVDVAVDVHRRRRRHREVGLAGAGGADAEDELVAEEVAHVELLRRGARLDQLAPGADLQGLAGEHVELAHPRLDRRRRAAVRRRPEPDRRLDVARRHRAALLQPLVEAAQHLLGLLALRRRPVQRQMVAAAVDRHAEARFDLDDVAVELAAKVDQEAVVGELQNSVGLIGQVGLGAGFGAVIANGPPGRTLCGTAQLGKECPSRNHRASILGHVFMWTDTPREPRQFNIAYCIFVSQSRECKQALSPYEPAWPPTCKAHSRHTLRPIICYSPSCYSNEGFPRCLTPCAR